MKFQRACRPAGLLRQHSLLRITLARASISLALVLCGAGSGFAATSTLIAWGGGQTNTPADLNDVMALSTAMDHSLALRAGGTVTAWGNNFDGQCDVPADLGSAKGVAAGAFFSVAVEEDGTVAAWGDTSGGNCKCPRT